MSYRCFWLPLAAGLATGTATIALVGGGYETIRPYGWQPRPAAARPVVRRAARPAVELWALRCWDTGYRGGEWAIGYGGAFGGPWGLPLGGFGAGGFGSYGGGYADHGAHRRGGRMESGRPLSGGAGPDMVAGIGNYSPFLPVSTAPDLTPGVPSLPELVPPESVPEPSGIGLALIALAATLGLHIHNRRT